MARYQELVEAMRNALKQGNMPLARRLKEAIENKEYESESSNLASALQGVGQGATLGFADEAAAGIRTGLDAAVGGMLAGFGVGDYKPIDEANEDTFLGRWKDYAQQYTAAGDRTIGEAYEENLASQRQALETARREDPWVTGIAEFAGGLGTGGIGMGKAVAGQALRHGLARGAGLGLGMGATAGYGYSEGDPIATALQEFIGPEDPNYERVMGELKEAGVGAAVGGTLGAGLGVGLPMAGSAIRATFRFLARPLTKNSRVNELGRRRILEALEHDLENGNMTIDEARKLLDDTPGMTVADLGDNLRLRGQDIAFSPAPAGVKMSRTLEQRGEQQYDRVMPAVSKALGLSGRPSQYHDELLAMMRSAKEAADPAYKLAYATPIQHTRAINQILFGTPSGRAAMKAAEKLQRELGKKTAPVGKLGSMISSQRMHYILQEMDAHVDKLFKGKGKKPLANAAKDTRDRLKEIVYQANPALKEANHLWMGHAQSRDALKLGLKIFRDDAGEMAHAVSRMTEGEKTYFRVGVLRALEKRLGSRLDTADITPDLLKRRNVKNALRIAFGSDEAFENVMNMLQQEALMQRTLRTVVGNSDTARKLARGVDFGEKLTQLAGYGATLSTGMGLPPSTGGYLAGQAYRAMGGPRRAQQTFNALAGREADLLMGQGGQALDPILRPHTLAGLLDTGVPVTTGAATGGLLAGGATAPGDN